MKSLTKDQESRLDAIREKIEVATSDLGGAVDSVNAQLRDLFADIVEAAITQFNKEASSLVHNELNPAICTYNDAVQNALDLRDEVVSDMENYFNDRFEKGREGKASEQYQGWIEAWQNFDLDLLSEGDDPELEEISAPEIELEDSMEALDAIDNLPRAAADV